MERRNFLKTSGIFKAGSLLISPASSFGFKGVSGKRRLALVGTGSMVKIEELTDLKPHATRGRG